MPRTQGGKGIGDRLSIAVGEMVAEGRVRLGLSQSELASLSGLHRSYIGDLERGRRNISIINLSKAATALGMKPSALVAEAELRAQTLVNLKDRIEEMRAKASARTAVNRPGHAKQKRARVSRKYDEKLLENLGVIVSSFRQRKHLSEVHMGELCGLSVVSLRRIERGEPVRLSVAGFAHLAAVLHLTVEKLMAYVRSDLAGSQGEKRYIKKQTDRVNERMQEKRDHQAKRAARLKELKERREEDAEKRKRQRRTDTSIATTDPWMVYWWDTKANRGLSPRDITRGSFRKVHWQCPEASDHKFEASPNRLFVSKKKCPFCAGTRASATNNLAMLHPDLAREFHRGRNSLAPEEVVVLPPTKTQRRYWWRCRYCQFEWSEKLSSRLSGEPCRNCKRLP